MRANTSTRRASQKCGSGGEVEEVRSDILSCSQMEIRVELLLHRSVFAGLPCRRPLHSGGIQLDRLRMDGRGISKFRHGRAAGTVSHAGVRFVRRVRFVVGRRRLGGNARGGIGVELWTVWLVLGAASPPLDDSGGCGPPRFDCILGNPGESCCCCFRRLLTAKKAKRPMTATPATTPTTMPAMAPPDSEDPPSLSSASLPSSVKGEEVGSDEPVTVTVRSD